MKEKLKLIDWKGVTMLHLMFLIVTIPYAWYEHDWIILPGALAVMIFFSLLVIVKILFFEKPLARHSSYISCTCDSCAGVRDCYVSGLYISIDASEGADEVMISIWDKRKGNKDLFLYLDRSGIDYLIKSLTEARPRYQRRRK